eukprot:191818-Pyramimonas_sp.AAC.2
MLAQLFGPALRSLSSAPTKCVGLHSRTDPRATVAQRSVRHLATLQNTRARGQSKVLFGGAASTGTRAMASSSERGLST